jgi:hypothetical protein
MCYFLHGAVNKEANEKDLAEITKDNYYHFNIGTKHDVKNSVLEAPGDFRITSGMCDCGTALGAHDKSHEEISELCALLNDMRLVRGIKCVYLSKNWAGKINKAEECVHIDDADIAELLAEMKENCIYRIDLYPRYY